MDSQIHEELGLSKDEYLRRVSRLLLELVDIALDNDRERLIEWVQEGDELERKLKAEAIFRPYVLLGMNGWLDTVVKDTLNVLSRYEDVDDIFERINKKLSLFV